MFLSLSPASRRCRGRSGRSVDNDSWRFRCVRAIFLSVATLASLVGKIESANLAGVHNNSSEAKVEWSTPEQCRRSCGEDEAPRYCYYHFTLEYYTTMNRACNLCRPGDTNDLSNVADCECVEADGYERTFFSINRMLPGPSIQVCLGDRLIIDVANQIEGVEVSLHWHGLFQKGFQYYDGVPYLTQCPIHFGNTFRYQFVAANAGTHFYHSHVAIHKIDGQYGSLVVRAPPSHEPHAGLYDEDLASHVILVSDWMHEMSVERYPGLLHRLQGPPANGLINGKGIWTDPVTKLRTNVTRKVFEVEANKRYRFRLINAFSSVCLAQLSIEDHRMRLIAQDGENVEPRWVDSIVTGSGERVDFVIHTKRRNNSAPTSYWIQLRGLGECGKTKVNQLAILRYKGATEPVTPEPTYHNGLPRGITYNPLEAQCDFDLDDESQRKSQHVCPSQLKSLTKVDDELLVHEADYRFMLPFTFYSYRHSPERLFKPGKYQHFFTTPSQDLLVGLVDNIAFKSPDSPPINREWSGDTMCDSRKKPANCSEPCGCAHTLRVRKDSIVEVVLYDQNLDPEIAHPFHLHGYTFRVLSMGRFDNNFNITRQDMQVVTDEHDKRLRSGYYKRAPAKDTIIVPQGGWVILRFKADNPGWWFFHCHFVWHSANGMNVMFNVGEPSDLPPVPPGFPRCGDFKPSKFPEFHH